MVEFSIAESLINQFKADRYMFGLGVLNRSGEVASQLGKFALLVRSEFPGSEEYTNTIVDSLQQKGVQVIHQIDGAMPNAPREDLLRISEEIRASKPDLLISFGGGSTIDAVKAANVLVTLNGQIDQYFGTGLVTKELSAQKSKLIPHLAIQTISSSGAHLTKYSNITEIETNQKKLIVDEAIIPERAIFDYRVTLNAPIGLTVDGALDGIAHAQEVLYSSVGKPSYDTVLPVALQAIHLILKYLPRILLDPLDITARHALGLGTDLGGYAIMLGGTNGPHLTSFSVVDVLSHGRACGLMNPYYTVFFSPAIEDALLQVAKIYQDLGYMKESPENLKGKSLGIATAQAMIEFEKSIGFPTTLGEIPGFSDKHIERILAAAKDPQLKMKLENMPIPMNADMVDEYMHPILLAAKTGDLNLIRNVT